MARTAPVVARRAALGCPGPTMTAAAAVASLPEQVQDSVLADQPRRDTVKAPANGPVHAIHAVTPNSGSGMERQSATVTPPNGDAHLTPRRPELTRGRSSAPTGDFAENPLQTCAFSTRYAQGRIRPIWAVRGLSRRRSRVRVPSLPSCKPARSGAGQSLPVATSSPVRRPRASSRSRRCSSESCARRAASAADWRAVVPEEPVRLLDGERPGRAESVAVHDGATVELPTPIAAAAEEGSNRAAVGDRRARPRLRARPPREPCHRGPRTAHIRRRLRAHGPERDGVHLDSRHHIRRREPRHEHGPADTPPDSAARSAKRRAGRRRLVLPGFGQGRLRNAVGANCSAGFGRWRPRSWTRPPVALSKPFATPRRRERAPRTAATSRSPTWSPCWATTWRAPPTSSTG